MSSEIIRQPLSNVNPADLTAGGSTSADLPPETPKAVWQSTVPDVSPEPPAVPASLETRQMIYAAQRRSFSAPPGSPQSASPEPLADAEEAYAAALEVVRRIEAALAIGWLFYTADRRRLCTVGEMVQAIVTGSWDEDFYQERGPYGGRSCAHSGPSRLACSSCLREQGTEEVGDDHANDRAAGQGGEE